MNDLHCKVFFRNELRRFPLNGVCFQDLQKIIQTLFGLDKEFTLLYRDNENDLVVLSSNEELVCALTCINGNVLQLVVQDPNPPTMDVDQKNQTPSPFSHPWGHPWGGNFRFHHHKDHGPYHPHFPPTHFPPQNYHHRHCHFGKMDQSKRMNRFCLKKEVLSQKLKEIESALLEFSGKEEGSSTPLQARRLFNNLQKKKNSLENQLLKLEEMPRWSRKKSEKNFKKNSKHEKKILKKMDKHEFLLEPPLFLTDVPQNPELAEAYAKFQALKPELEEINIQLKACKAALKEAQQRGESTDQWVHEISMLKEAKKAKKQQIIPLGMQIRNMSAPVVH